MRMVTRWPCLVAALGVGALMACSKPLPPQGRWEGIYQAGDVMIAARLEVEPNGAVRVSAPNAFMDFAKMSDADRDAMRTRMIGELAKAWPNVAPVTLDFDGKIFRKPGGVAPQLEWDSATKRMTAVVYPGTHPTIRMPLDAVGEFSGGG